MRLLAAVLSLALAFPALAENITVTPNAAAGGSASITVGTTTISGGTNTRVLFDNAGVVGEYTAAQVTAFINLATGALQGALPAWPSNTTTFFRGDGTYATLNCAALSNATASCSTDATNASNIASGTLPTGRLTGAYTGITGLGTIAGLTVSTSFTATGLVTNASLASMSTSTIKGQTVGGSGAPVDLTATQAAAVIGSVGGVLKSALITSTRDLTAATGNVAYTGMGFQPTTCFGTAQISASANQYTTMVGFAPSLFTASTAVALGAGAGIVTIVGGVLFSLVDSGGTNLQNAAIASYDADGLTLTWTKTGTPTGTANLRIMCYR